MNNRYPLDQTCPWPSQITGVSPRVWTNGPQQSPQFVAFVAYGNTAIPTQFVVTFHNGMVLQR